jgi:predicted ATPase/DNA-binding SARP family transcriptional activator
MVVLMPDELQLSVLGRPQILLGGQPLVDLVSVKAQALLIYLAVTRKVYSRSALAGLFWGDWPEDQARANLRQTLTKLRKAVGDHLTISWETVSLTHDLVQHVDAVDFLTLMDRTRSHCHRRPETCGSCAEHWQNAAALYQNAFLYDFSLPDCPEFELWIVAERERLHQQALEGLERLSAYFIRCGGYTQAQLFARRQLELDPFRETSYRQLMLALSLAGQRPAALAQYQACLRQLQDEFDIEPEQATQDLYQAIKQGHPLETHAGMRHNLPAPVTPFFGRQAECVHIRRQIEDPHCRLLSLVGPGGVGKSRLALEAAVDLRIHFEDGIFFVALAPLRDARLVLGAIAQALGVKDTGSQPLCEKLKGALCDRELLLILDNFEHVLDAALLIGELLASCRRLSVLATSREALRLTGEHVYVVPPLAVLSPCEIQQVSVVESLLCFGAVQLFVDRTQAIVPDFIPTPEATRTVAEICYWLDGLPLGIELAAGQMRHMHPTDMLGWLSCSAASSLQLLTQGARDMPMRQQTMRATIAWSYNLLDGPSKALFRRLAVFRGGCTLLAAEAVASELKIENEKLKNGPEHRPFSILNSQFSISEELESLVRKHLLQQTSDDQEQRYLSLEAIREFALEQLNESGDAQVCRRQHALFFLALSEQAEPELSGRDQQRWLTRLEAEHDNLRAALQWAIEISETEIALRMASALWRFWDTRGYVSQGCRWLEDALAQAEAATAAVRAKALNALGMLYLCRDDYPAAQSRFEEGLRLRRALGDMPGIAVSLNNLGLVAWWQGNYSLAHKLYQECLAIDRATGDTMGIGYSLGNLGLVAHHQGHRADAQAAFDESLAIFRQLGNRRHEAFALHNLGMLAYHQNDLQAARSLYETSLSIKQELGDKWGIASTLVYLASVTRRQGDLTLTGELLLRSLGLRQELSDTRGLVETLEGFAGYAVALQRADVAGRLFGAAQSIRMELGFVLHTADRAERDCNIEAARCQLTSAAFKTAFTDGQAMSLEQALAFLSAIQAQPAEDAYARP